MVAVASPGADLAVVVKNTLRCDRKIGVATAIGVGVGIFVHLIYTLLGLAILLSQSEYIFKGVKIAGALYLLWMAQQALRSKPKQAAEHKEAHKEMRFWQAFRQGFLTNVLNPKVTLFFLVLFTSIVSQQTPLFIQSLYGLWLAFYTTLWFTFVAWMFSRKVILAWYESHGHFFDWGMGLFFVFIAVNLFIEIV